LTTALAILAQQAPQWVNIFRSPLTLVFVLIIFMWIFMINSKRKQDRRRQDMLKQIKKGDRIQTIGGILGTVVEVREQDDEVVVKVDESSNAKIRFIRGAISRVVEQAERERAEVKS